MILSMPTDVTAYICGDENAVELIAKAGFDAADYSMFCMQDDSHILNTDEYINHAKKLKAIADNHGIIFNQAHAPFPSYKIDDEEYNTKIFEKIRRAIEVAGILGAKNIVVHPTDYRVPSEENLKKNYEFYMRLVPFIKEYGVKVAVENMFGRDKRRDYIVANICSMPDEFRRMMDMLDPQYFTACVDIGHAGLVGTSAPELIRGLGHEYVTCLHVHDNDYKDDMHLPPYFCELDWDEITQALADINYSGDFTFESDAILEHFPKELVPSVLSLIHDIGRHLIAQIEQKSHK